MQRYAICADRDLLRLPELFAEDGIWVRPGNDMRGHREMRAFVEQVQRGILASNPNGHLTRHMFTTSMIEAQDDDHASGIFYALVFRDEHNDGTLPRPMNMIELVVEYRTDFKRTESGWRIVRHEAEHVFRR